MAGQNLSPPIGSRTYERRCAAHRTNGEACKKNAILGGTVCDVHGGRAPQVKRAAAERLAEMVDPAITELGKLMRSADSEQVQLAAIKDILDRAGYKATEKVQQDGTMTVEVVYQRTDHPAGALPGAAPDRRAE